MPNNFEGFEDSQSYLKHLLQTHGKHALMKLNENEMLMNLITTFYLNLSRKLENVERLLTMRTFEYMSILVHKYILHKENIIESAKNAAKSSL